jgi:hypothetical protein
LQRSRSITDVTIKINNVFLTIFYRLEEVFPRVLSSYFTGLAMRPDFGMILTVGVMDFVLPRHAMQLWMKVDNALQIWEVQSPSVVSQMK